MCQVLVALCAIGLAWVLRPVPGKPWALSHHYEPRLNPAWGAARWRADEHPTQTTFNQWWYMMITDTHTNVTYSIGLGGFRGDWVSGGWIRRKRPGVPYRSKDFPELRVSFESLVSRGDLDVSIYSTPEEAAATTSPAAAGAASTPLPQPAIALRAVSDDTLDLRVRMPGDATGADVRFRRVYGVLGYGRTAPNATGSAEECSVANIPFAYASRVTGRLWFVDPATGEREVVDMPGDDHDDSSSGGRFRAYVESTWACRFPEPPQGASVDPITYPWKWMWAVVPPAASSSSPLAATAAPLTPPAPRSGSERGEVGLVVSNARLGMPLGALGSIDTHGTFAFLDLPHGRRIAAVNVTVFDTSALPLPLLLAAPEEVHELRAVYMEHGNWADVTDEYGTAPLPMRQTLTLVTDRYYVRVEYASEPRDFARIPVKYLSLAGYQKTISDFRASFSTVRILVAENTLGSGGSSGEAPVEVVPVPPGRGIPPVYNHLLLDAVAPHNGVEFAYHAPYAEGSESVMASAGGHQ